MPKNWVKISEKKFLKDVPENVKELWRTGILIVKNRNELFFREYRGAELHNIIKPLFFKNENLNIESVFWSKNQQIFKIIVNFNSN